MLTFCTRWPSEANFRKFLYSRLIPPSKGQIEGQRHVPRLRLNDSRDFCTISFLTLFVSSSLIGIQQIDMKAHLITRSKAERLTAIRGQAASWFSSTFVASSSKNLNSSTNKPPPRLIPRTSQADSTFWGSNWRPRKRKLTFDLWSFEVWILISSSFVYYWIWRLRRPKFPLRKYLSYKAKFGKIHSTSKFNLIGVMSVHCWDLTLLIHIINLRYKI